MLLLTGEIIWIVAFVLFIAYVIYFKKYNYYALIITSGIGITITDLTAFRIFKPFFGRLRPCHAFPEQVNLITETCGGTMGFPSNHASNAMVVATLFTLTLKGKYRYFPICIGLLIGFTRVYLGVHYLGDILFGSLFGATVAVILYATSCKIQTFYKLPVSPNKKCGS